MFCADIIFCVDIIFCTDIVFCMFYIFSNSSYYIIINMLENKQNAVKLYIKNTKTSD